MRQAIYRSEVVPEEQVTVQLNDAEVVAVGPPVLLNAPQHWLQVVVAYQVLILYLKINLVYRWNLEPRKNPFLRKPKLLLALK